MNSTLPRLYGISKENSNRSSDEMWGKNCFNSSFPVALACYMRDRGEKAVYVCATQKGGKSGNKEMAVANEDISIGEVFNSDLPNESLQFNFEEKFSPYLPYAHGGKGFDNADLVVSEKDTQLPLRPFQIKLTVTPDDGTSRIKDEKLWGPELVLRPSDLSILTLGVFHKAVNFGKKHDAKQSIKELFDDACYGTRWDALNENLKKQRQIFSKVARFVELYHNFQQPFLLQPIWKTVGKTPNLAVDHALDIFVWSDYAILMACLKKAKPQESSSSRGFRSIARFARAVHELATRGNIDLHEIYRHMDFGRQTDKEIAFSGRQTVEYMTSPRRFCPLFPPDVVSDVILNGGHKKLSPERRFDQTIYFAAEKYFTAE